MKGRKEPHKVKISMRAGDRPKRNWYMQQVGPKGLLGAGHGGRTKIPGGNTA